MKQPHASTNPFLASVIDRAYERVPLVEPRRASRFESAEAPTDLPETDVQAALPRAATRPAVAAPAPAVSAIAPRLAAADTTPRDSAVDATSRAPEEAPVARRAPMHVAAPAALAPAGTRSSPSVDMLPSGFVNNVTASPAAGMAHANAVPPEVLPAVPPTIATKPAAPPLRESPNAPSVAAAQPEPRMVQSFAAAVPASERGDARASNGVPHVTISIGRIDVRAAAPAATAARTNTPPRTAALSDYLGRRERTR